MLRRLLRGGLVGAVGLFVILQVVPYGRAHSNPPVQQEPAWDSPQTRHLAARACFDCHSNQTQWPWYSHIAPASWLVQNHVDEGRAKLNFSEWNRPQGAAPESGKAVQEGEMPLPSYVWAHPKARLSPAESQTLVQGLQATFGGEVGHGGDGHEKEEED
jgi:heme-binding protein